MVAILVDLELARAMAHHYTEDEEAAAQLLAKNAQLVYQAHNTDLEVFQSSYAYYLDRLDVLKGICETVITRLEELEEQRQGTTTLPD
jgi:hypothetical protein